MSKILITGGAGFIGFHLAKNILDHEPDAELWLVDNLSRGVVDSDLEQLLANPRVTFKNLNLLAAEQMEELPTDFTFIFHFAAIIGVQHVINRPYNVLVDNVKMHDHMLQFAKTCPKLARFVFTSTSEIYAGTLEKFGLSFPTTEVTPLAANDLDRPRTSYMLSKMYGEAMCLHSGVPCTIVRPHNFYGPRMGLSHVIPELLKKAYEAADGDHIPVYSVDHQRTFCYIADAVEYIWRLAQSEAALQKAFNIGTETPEVAIGSLAEAAFAAVGRQIQIDAKPDTHNSPPRRCPSMARTKEVTGYDNQFSLNQGISQTYQWYRDQVFAAENAISAH